MEIWISKIDFLFSTLLIIAQAASPKEITVKEIRIEGNNYTKDKTILHYCDFRVGERLTKEDLDQKIKKPPGETI
jgi:outer membrane protein assembly factor BamA